MKRTIQLLLDVEVETEQGTKRQAAALAKGYFCPRELSFGFSFDTGAFVVTLSKTKVVRAQKED